MIMAAVLFTVAMHASPRMITHRRVGLPRMCDTDQECVALYVDVSPAAKSAREHLCTEDAQQKEAMLDTLLVPAGDEAYFSTRHILVGKGPGKLNSSALLTHDEAHGFYPPLLDADRTRQQMAFVDELRCVGCTFCAAIARHSFVVHEEYGTARVAQQGSDVVDAIEEAMESCPTDCIHWCTRDELEVLEEHRELHLHRMLGQGNNGLDKGHWRDPLESNSWRTAWHDGWDDSRHTREDGQQRDDVPR